MRTPLTTVGLRAETLSRDADPAGASIPPKMRDRIAKIEVETGHLVQMVSEIMDLSRIESGTGLTLIDDLDLGRVADGLGRTITPLRGAPARDAAGRCPARAPAYPG